MTDLELLLSRVRVVLHCDTAFVAVVQVIACIPYSKIYSQSAR